MAKTAGSPFPAVTAIHGALATAQLGLIITTDAGAHVPRRAAASHGGPNAQPCPVCHCCVGESRKRCVARRLECPRSRGHLIAWVCPARGKDVVSMPWTRPPYPEGFRREAVALIRSGQRSLAEASRSLGVSQQTLRTWLKREDVDAGRAEGVTSEEREELRRLRREVRVLREEREILKKAAAFFVKENETRLRCFGSSRRRRRVTPASTMCRVLEVSRSDYYARSSRPLSARRWRTRRWSKRSVVCTLRATGPTGPVACTLICAVGGVRSTSSGSSG